MGVRQNSVNKAKTPTNQAKGGPRKRKRRRDQAWGVSGVRGFVAVDLEARAGDRAGRRSRRNQSVRGWCSERTARDHTSCENDTGVTWVFGKTGVNKAKTPTNQAKDGPQKEEAPQELQAWDLMGDPLGFNMGVTRVYGKTVLYPAKTPLCQSKEMPKKRRGRPRRR